MPLADTDAEYQQLVDEEKRLDLEIKKRALEQKIKQKKKLAKRPGTLAGVGRGFVGLGKLAAKGVNELSDKKGKKN